MIIAGTAVGAGMFSLPIAMSGIWFGWAHVDDFLAAIATAIAAHAGL